MSINLPKQLSSPMGLSLRQGVVTGTPDNINLTCSVFIAGNDTAVSLKYMAHVSPVSGDPVWIMQNGTDMLVVGKTKTGAGGTQSASIFGDGLELYHPSSIPYIDFHRAANPAGDSNADYNMRIINNVNGYLEVFGGRVRVGWAEMGTHPVHTNYAWFGRTAQAASTDYSFLTNGDESIINATGAVYQSRNGAWVTRVDASGFWVNDDIGLPTDRAIYFKSPWDGAHIIHHASGDDGFRYVTWNYHRFYMQGAERFRMHPGGFQLFGQNNINWPDYGGTIWMQDGTWERHSRGIYNPYPYKIYSEGMLVSAAQYGSVGMMNYNESDTNHRMYYDHGTGGDIIQGWGFAALRSIQYDHAVECGRGGNATRHVNQGSSVWRYSDAQNHTNFSDPRFKTNLQRMPKQKQKVKDITPIKFQWDANQAPPESRTTPDNFGFNADELPDEVIHLSFLMDERTGKRTPVKMMDPVGVLAMLWEAFQELDDECDELAVRLTALEEKGKK